MRRILAAALAATSFFPIALNAAEQALDGVLWSYETTQTGAVVTAANPLPYGDTLLGAAAPEEEGTTAPAFETLKIPEAFGEFRVVEIGEGAFAEHDEIREVKVPDGVVRIGSRAFKDCRGLRGVRLPSTTVEIGDRAFSGCRSLRAINLGANITNISERAFRDCRSLASIDLPENLANIGDKAFSDCSSLHVVTIPRGVTNIAEWAFADCTSLATVVFLGPEPVVGEDAFARVDANCFFRASSAEGWSVEIPGTWQGRRIVDLTIETYRRRILIFLPMIVGAIGTVAILVLAIVLRERHDDEDEVEMV